MGFSIVSDITQTFGINFPETTLSLVLCGTTPRGANAVSSDPNVQMDLALIANPLLEMIERDVAVKLLYLLYARAVDC